MYDWDNITLGKLQRLIDVSKRVCSNDIEVIDRDIELVAIINGITIDDVEQMQSEDFKHHRKQLYDLFASASSVSPVNKIVINDISFYFDGAKNLKDIQELAKANGITPETFARDYASALASFYHPSRLNGVTAYKKYSDPSKRAELFEKAPASAVFALSNLIAASTPILGKLILQRTEQLYKELGEQVDKLDIPEN